MCWFTTFTARSHLTNQMTALPTQLSHQVNPHLMLHFLEIHKKNSPLSWFAFSHSASLCHLCPSISVHQRRRNGWFGPQHWRWQKEVCELRHDTGDDSWHDDLHFLPAAGHDRRHLQSGDVCLVDVLALYLLRVSVWSRVVFTVCTGWACGLFLVKHWKIKQNY